MYCAELPSGCVVGHICDSGYPYDKVDPCNLDGGGDLNVCYGCTETPDDAGTILYCMTGCYYGE